MSDLSCFLKKNKAKRENAFYPAASDLTDKEGKPLLWEIKPLTTREVETLRSECTREVPLPGKKGQYRMTLDERFGVRLCAAAVVFPDLNNAALQDSYGVKTPEDLLMAMIDDPGEFSAFMEFVQQLGGIGRDREALVQQAKN